MGNRLIWGNRARKGLPAAELHLGRAHDAASSKKTQAGCEERLRLAPVSASGCVKNHTRRATRRRETCAAAQISPLSNISLRRARTAFYSCETAHEASKRDRRPADLGVRATSASPPLSVVPSTTVGRPAERSSSTASNVLPKRNAKKMQEGAPVRFLTAVGTRTT